jgi:hypothetical protein
MQTPTENGTVTIPPAPTETLAETILLTSHTKDPDTILQVPMDIVASEIPPLPNVREAGMTLEALGISKSNKPAPCSSKSTSCNNNTEDK